MVLSAMTTSSQRYATDVWPRISIVTPCYNMAECLEETMQSVLRQDYPDLEYIIVDGGSTDGSLDIINQYDEHLSWWISEPDDGMYDAIQKGFSESSGEVMAWINADDILHRRSLRTVGELFTAFPDVDWIQGRPTWIDSVGRIINATGSLKRWSRFDYYLGNYRWIQQESTFWRRRLWRQAGGYVSADLNYAGDLELWARFFRHAYLYSTDAVLGAFRYRSGQLSENRFGEYVQEAQRILRRERNRLSTEDRTVLRRMQWLDRLCSLASRLPGFCADKFHRHMRASLVDLPALLRFDRDTQSFHKSTT
jgi:glycosyltransferase involved in cell wall biosynthesis